MKFQYFCFVSLVSAQMHATSPRFFLETEWHYPQAPQTVTVLPATQPSMLAVCSVEQRIPIQPESPRAVKLQRLDLQGKGHVTLDLPEETNSAHLEKVAQPEPTACSQTESVLQALLKAKRARSGKSVLEPAKLSTSFDKNQQRQSIDSTSPDTCFIERAINIALDLQEADLTQLGKLSQPVPDATAQSGDRALRVALKGKQPFVAQLSGLEQDVADFNQQQSNDVTALMNDFVVIDSENKILVAQQPVLVTYLIKSFPLVSCLKIYHALVNLLSGSKV